MENNNGSRFSKIEILEAATRWDRIAEEAEEAARWDATMGFFVGAVESSPGYHRARAARDCATSLRMEADTGLPHCVCHLKPRRQCFANPSVEASK